ncbi:unnamed protein product, partial [Scytosiphon promiscuus]
DTDEYEGCFADTEQRVMADMLVDDDMTQVLCRSHCEDNGALYYATQYGNECFCGYSNAASDYEIYGEATCDMKCAGDSSSKCGGNWAFSLYKLADDTEVSAPQSSSSSRSTLTNATSVPRVKPFRRLQADQSNGYHLPLTVFFSFPFLQESAPPASGFSAGQYGAEYNGDGTYYGETTQGNCAFGGNVPGMYSGMIPIALNRPQYSDSLMCGACLEGKASGNGNGANPIPSTFKGYITDQCPECSTGDLDFSVSGDGRWDIEWEFVACPGESISFKFEGSNQWYWKLQPQGTKTPVVSLTINGKAASRTDDNHFVLEGGPWHGPQTVVTTTVAGVIRTSQASC